MSAVSNSVMPRSIALWITLREVSRSVRCPKLLQPRPTAETRKPEPPRLRICMTGVLWGGLAGNAHSGARISALQGAILPGACGRYAWRGRGPANAEKQGPKKCGPGQTRRLTGTAGALDL